MSKAINLKRKKTALYSPFNVKENYHYQKYNKQLYYKTDD